MSKRGSLKKLLNRLLARPRALADPVHLPEADFKQVPLAWLNDSPVTSELQYLIREILQFRDTLYVSGWVEAVQEVRGFFVVYVNEIRWAEFGAPAKTRANFTAKVPIPEKQPDGNVKIGFELKSGARVLIESPSKQSWDADTNYHALFQKYRGMLNALVSGKMVEIGSRARSGYTFRDIVPPGVDYVGMDIKAGPNVDLVGDAHKLSSYFAADSVDAILSIAVFEHLLMPWKVALEMNSIMKTGGVAFISTHQTFPLHEEPWDFWRFSNKAWHALFNRSTGFEIIDTTYGERAFIVPSFTNARIFRMDRASAFMVSQVLVRKIGTTTERWNVEMDDLVENVYPF